MLGQIIEDRYLVEAELGEGAMGHVYRARHIKVGRQVAIKVMHAELARQPQIIERFAREARIAARLHHPNLVSVFDVGTTNDAARLPLIVLELAPGTPLTDLTLEPLAREQVVTLIRQLLHALDHAHAAGLIHRDLKPDNILVERRPDGTLMPRIVDFGIAVCSHTDDPIAGRRLTAANTVIGTPLYMSPEQAMAKDVDARSDLFSLGVIMFELLSGTQPFDGDGVDIALANATLDAPTIAERAGILVDPLLEVFVRKLMARRLDERFQTAHEALTVLELIDTDRIAAARALGTGPIAPLPVTLPPLATGSGNHLLPTAVTHGLPTDSDARATHDAPVDDADEIVELSVRSAVPAPRFTEVTRVEHIAGIRPARRRALRAGALVVAAMTAVVGWSFARDPKAASRTASSMAVTSAPPVSPASTVAPTPVPSTVTVSPTATPVTDSTAGGRPLRASPAKRVVKPATPAKSTTKPSMRPAVPAATASTAMTTTPPAPAAAAPTRRAPAYDANGIETVQSIADRYMATGKALRGASSDLWARYRLINLNEAFRDANARRSASATLDQLERALAKP